MYPVSKPMSKNESLAQTSGQAEYIIDMPDLPGQLFGAFVLAKIKPMSIIRKIDTTEAMVSTYSADPFLVNLFL